MLPVFNLPPQCTLQHIFHYTTLADNLAMAFQAIVLEESEMQNPTALCTRLLFKKGYLVEGHPGFVRRLFREEKGGSR